MARSGHSDHSGLSYVTTESVYLSYVAGAFVGCALNGSLVSTRDTENARFYGGPIKAPDILMGSMARPPAAAALYKVLSELFDNPEKQSL